MEDHLKYCLQFISNEKELSLCNRLYFATTLGCKEIGIRKSEFMTKTQFLSIYVKCNLAKLIILIFFFFPKNRINLLPINQYCNIVLYNYSFFKTNKYKYLVEVYYTTKRPKKLSICNKLRFLIAGMVLVWLENSWVYL